MWKEGEKYWQENLKQTDQTEGDIRQFGHANTAKHMLQLACLYDKQDAMQKALQALRRQVSLSYKSKC